MLEANCFDGKTVNNCLDAQMQSVESARLAVPREGKTGRRPPTDFGQPQHIGFAPPRPRVPGGRRGSFPRGFREEPGSLASRI